MFAAAISLIGALLALPGFAAGPEAPSVRIPKVQRAPVLEDFLGMEAGNGMAGQMVKVSGFVQQEPSDGAPATKRTDVYLGYDDKNLYAVFVAFDPEPDKVRARWTARERIFDDDNVEIMLDTFHDERRAFAFLANPLGIQADALFTEGQGGRRGFDFSFDTLWHSEGKLTDRGYVVWMAIPFKSLRFPDTPAQTWGLVLHRSMTQDDERVFWPHISSRIEGRMNQAGDLTGLEDISPGRNIQLIPYGSFRSFRALDDRDENFPRFVERDGDFDGGLDAKFVLKDSFVLDVAINPDFSQVESDEPRVTTNQRFEVFFPERRPFFIENASFFRTPVNLVFTRRVADPQFGVRLTGKAGPWAIGAMLTDDESPGKIVPLGDPDEGKRASFGIFRLNRDLPNQSTIGIIYAQRDFRNLFNRVGGVDGRWKFNENWDATFQAVASSSRFEDEDTNQIVEEAGPAYEVQLARAGRQLSYRATYRDIGREFRTESGFVRRRDIRELEQRAEYDFRPEGPVLVSWGPSSNTQTIFDHTGTRLDFTQDTTIGWNLRQQTNFGIFYFYDKERIRPEDDCGTTAVNLDFKRTRRGFWFNSEYLDWLEVRMRFGSGQRINCEPRDGDPPVLANSTIGDLSLGLRPLPKLQIDNTYIFNRLTSRLIDASIFNNHIFRSRWNWQFNRELSLRVILQYDALLTHSDTTSLETRKNINGDVLLTYLIHPGTVLFIGYNSNLQNIAIAPVLDPVGDPVLDMNGNPIFEVIRNRRRYINDGRGFFVKFSYLYRF